MLARVLALVCAVVVVLADALVASAADANVDIRNFAFVPKVVTVSVGERVTWRNFDSTFHTVHWNDVGGPVDSLPLTNGGPPYTATFTEPGSYSYVCGIHPATMAGLVVVQAVATPTPTAAPSTPRPTATPTASGSASPSATGSPSATPSPPASAPPPATATPPAAPSPTLDPLAAPANQTNQLVGLGLIATGVAIAIGALWWRFARV